MPSDLILVSSGPLSQVALDGLPTIIAAAGEQARWRLLEFFTVNICSKNTPLAYLRAIRPFLLWCEVRGLRDLRDIKPIVVVAYVEQHPCAARPTWSNAARLPSSAPRKPPPAWRRSTPRPSRACATAR